MRIGILQCDGSIPNLACMKIAGYHLSKGDQVETYIGGLFDARYDFVYASKIFSFTPNPEIPTEKSLLGGTGIDFYNNLPEEIEKHEPSYLLYPDCNYHLGFSMKGCRFACEFCCVPKKEGKPRLNNTIDQVLINPNAKKNLMLLDNDFFGGKDWKDNLLRIIEIDLKVCFVQGLNIRILTEEQAELLSKVKYRNSKFNDKYLTFAWDKYKDGERVIRGIQMAESKGIPAKNMQFFVLIGFDSTHEQNLERVMTLKKLGAMPFVMPYNKFDPYQRSFARWVNHRAVFKSTSWENYKRKVDLKI